MPRMSPLRLFTAYGTAAVIAALLAGVLTMAPFAMVLVMGFVLAFELVVLLPIHIALHHRGKVTRRTVLAMGMFAGALPWAWFAWPLRHPEMRTTASVGGVQTMVDGVPTLAGWLEYGSLVAFFALCGLVAAAGFWGALGKRDRAPAPATKDDGGSTAARAPRWQAVTVATAMGVIVALPVATKDRSCHNVFRDRPVYSLSGPNSARPKANLDFPANVQEWNDIAQLIVSFGRERGLDVLDMTEHDEGFRQIYVSLCNEGGTVISILDRIYFFGPPMERREELSVSIFGMRPGADWKRQADALEGVLRTRYGEKLRREDPPTASVSELASRLKSVHESPRFSVDELVDPEGRSRDCRGKRVEVRHVGALPAGEEHEFEVSCDAGRHRFITRTRVDTHERLVFTTREAAQLPSPPDAAGGD